MSFDQRVQAEALVQLTRQQQPGVGGHRRAVELYAKLGSEREANWARFRVTHWVVPSAPARSPREPHFLRVGRDYGLIRSPFKTKMRVKSLLTHVPRCNPLQANPAIELHFALSKLGQLDAGL